ncbi:NAD-dependent epimerase/dehydratase family protein [Phormidium yuhuli AB48]|uniref:UDP-glucose 4-epimerase n=1 Tax=Phormidium yuhuli AB48 TaxID=2940671 RepID=A0ABY5AMU7_9CYAN|nr:NAD-dependent epimerase/dehydratase family protein [Phormidium yuhuli]USR89559.1 NAD-dependent epimerase/dehydratase family protein [Phormidium yuhuli AB48]
MRILVIGGTRFIGVYLTRELVEAGHEVVLFNRGNHPAPVEGVAQITGDRTDEAQLQAGLAGESFDAIFDNTGRKLGDTQPLADLFKGKLKHFVYVSSAGVYQPSDQMPHCEGDALDPQSRHRGKFEAEDYLLKQGFPMTSVRPTYIYGPGNYNPIEAWFFDRLVRDRPIPIPGSGLQITQLGHCGDLAKAMVAILGNQNAVGEVYNISGDRYVTFDGLARACAIAVGKDPAQVQLVHYDPKALDLGKRKAFPLRSQHFFCSIGKALSELDWEPEFDLISGLQDSYEHDYLAGQQHQAEVDFSLDDQILATV